MVPNFEDLCQKVVSNLMEGVEDMLKTHLPSQVDAFKKLDGRNQLLRVINHNAKLFYKDQTPDDIGFSKWGLSAPGWS
jgi:hypothetical protein